MIWSMEEQIMGGAGPDQGMNMPDRNNACASRDLAGSDQRLARREEAVKFGDASAVDSGRIYSFAVVAVLLLAWILSSAFGWIEPFFWPTINGTWNRIVRLVTEGFRNIPSLGACRHQRLSRTVWRALRYAPRRAARFGHGPVFCGARFCSTPSSS